MQCVIKPQRQRVPRFFARLPISTSVSATRLTKMRLTTLLGAVSRVFLECGKVIYISNWLITAEGIITQTQKHANVIEKDGSLPLQRSSRLYLLLVFNAMVGCLVLDFSFAYFLFSFFPDF